VLHRPVESASEWSRIASSCLETRTNSEAVYIKRATGEVVALRPD